MADCTVTDWCVVAAATAPVAEDGEVAAGRAMESLAVAVKAEDVKEGAVRAVEKAMVASEVALAEEVRVGSTAAEAVEVLKEVVMRVALKEVADRVEAVVGAQARVTVAA